MSVYSRPTLLNNLYKSHCLTFTQKTTAPTIGRDGRVVDSNDSETIIAEGHLIPFREYNNKLVLPQGVREQDVKIFYSKVKTIRQADEKSKLPAALTTIDGDVYEVFNKRPWDGSKPLGIIRGTDNYDYVLIRQNPVEPSP